MNNFLTRINASDKLKNSLKDSKVLAQIETNENKIRVTFSNVAHLCSNQYIELFIKISSTVEEQMEMPLSFVKFEIEQKDELIHTYESIREFIKWKNEMINLSHIFISKSEDNELLISIAREEVVEEIEKLKDDLNDYLNDFAITNRKIQLELNPDLFSEQKLNRIIDESLNKKYNSSNNVEILDEKPLNGYSEIDFDIKQEKQQKVFFQGIVFDYEVREAKTGTKIHSFNLGESSKAIKVTVFDKTFKMSAIKNGDAIRVYGLYEFDQFAKSHVLKSFTPLKEVQKISHETLYKIEKETYPEKRYEFHTHTKMSTLDGVANVKDYVRYAEAYNIGSITITDHNTAQAFPEAYYASKGTDVIINYGVELDVYDDLNSKIVINEREQELLDAEYIFFDLETTSVSAWLSEIIEFGGVKYRNNKVSDRKQLFIKPNREISEFTTNLTSITNDDVKDAPSIEEAVKEIKEWIGDSILVAHNASFDFSFLNKAFIDAGLGPIENPIVDSMKLSWLIHPSARSHRLGVLAKNEFIPYDSEAAHRADYDAEVLAKIYERIKHKLLQNNIRNLNQLNELMDIKLYSSWTKDKIVFSKNRDDERLRGKEIFEVSLKNYLFAKHITVVSKNQEGLKDLNEIISKANIDFFNPRKKTAMIPLSFFLNKEEKLLKNVIVGSSCSNGILFNAILDADWEMVESIISIYDYLEIFPPSSYKHLINNHVINQYELKIVFKKIKEYADKFNIPLIVSSNAHYPSQNDKEFRNILISAKRVGGGGHPLNNYKNPNIEKPNNHLRNTKEIFAEFKGIFSDEEIKEITIDAPKKIQSQIEKQKPIKDDLYAPKIPGAEDNLKQSIKEKIAELYGANPAQEILDRVDRELSPIIDHGFAIIYYLSAIAVKKSNEDGYLVGSRGSVGSSLAATFSGITEVNPLRPHYRCPKCKYHEFNDEVDDGYDLPNKNCPVCQEKMIGDGHKIPFETFLGFNAEKVPDIDLNFSRDNQSDIHLYMKELLGDDNVFRAGTISTAAPKTAIGYVKNYEELTGKTFNNATIEWLSSKVEGAKRTTGQHPGGLIVIPSDMSVYDFTPINYPGDDSTADWKTTHFDFHSIHDNLLKLDLLGHLDPSSVRMLQTLTGVDPKTIPMNDKEVISLFESNKTLRYIDNYTNEELGILGIPEFGTNFVRDLVRESKPKSFADLVRISGLSHGTDVWAGNAQKLIKNNIATLSEVISVRDDIMTYLIDKGMDKSMSFDIMESVRKGKGLTAEWEHSMRDNNIPDWYIESCKLIKYMFPKAHATAYVMMAFRIAWYKINYPLEYYATYFSKRDVEIDLSIVLKGIDEMKKHYDEIKSLPRFEKTKKDEDLIDTYLIIFEMYSRGIEFENVNIHKSRTVNYEINRDTGNLVPPFSIIPGVGSLVSKSATENRRKKPFESISDFKQRSGLPKKVIESLEKLDVFKNEKGIEETTQQLSLFE